VSAFLRALEIALLAAPVVPLMRLFRIEGFVLGFGRIAATLAVLILMYLGGIAMIALFLPPVLPLLGAFVAAGLAVAYWFSRASYGMARGLPPGSLSLVASFEAIFDHRFYLKQAQRYGPVFKMMQFNKPLVCVVGLEKGHELIHQPDVILGPAPQPFSAEIPGGFLRYMAPETHAAYALKFRTAFSRNVTTAAEPVVREAIRSDLERMAQDSRSNGGTQTSAYMQHAMFVSFARLIFGFTPESDEMKSFRETCRLFDAQDLAQPLRPEPRKALSELRSQVLRQIDRLRENSGEECVLTEWLLANPGTPDQTVLDNFLFLFRIGVNNVSSLLRWVLKMLGDHPEWGERVRREGNAVEQSALAERIVMETLRLEQSEYIYRVVKRTMAIDEYRIPPGWRFRLCVRESHRDPTIFESPDSFDPDRFLDRKGNRSEYSPFGTDRHACIAVQSSHVVAQILVEELTRNYQWEVTRDGPRERPPRHWHHWEPSSRFALSLSRIPSA
jgi:cytochrome P450